MMHTVYLLQVLHRNVSIDLRRRNVRMAQQCLHSAEVSAMLDHMRRAAMP
jgi:hypothetical protein